MVDLVQLITDRHGIRVGVVGLVWDKPRVTIAVDIQKEAGSPTGGGIGVEFRPYQILSIRLGAGSYPERMALGIGITRGRAAIDYGILVQTVLGYSHLAPLSYSR